MLDKAKIINEYVRMEYKGPYHSVSDDSVQYELLASGDDRAVEEAMKMFLSDKVGVVSLDELRNAKYIFVAGLTLLTRASVNGGLDSFTAYSLSDAFIQRMDPLGSVDEIREVYRQAWSSFLSEVKKARGRNLLSKPIYGIVQYIYSHLHEPLTLSSVAAEFGYSASYVSTRFKRETGESFKAYVLGKKLETAKELLINEGFSVAEISDIFAFSSPSHFVYSFKRKYGVTPKEYRDRNYR